MSPSRPTRLVLARHGETVWHQENRYAGRSDIDLTDLGVEQSHRLAAWTKRVRPDVVVCSPLSRAIETARPSAESIGVPLRVIAELAEVDFGLAEGRTLHEMRELDPVMVQRFRDNPADNHFPGAEPPASAAARAAGALSQLASEYPGGVVLVVAHNTLLRLGICRILGLPVSRYRQVFPRLDNTSLTELSLPSDGSGRGSLLSLNVPADCG